MTVSSTTNRKSFTGDGVTTSFGTSPVVFFNSSELVVQVITTATGAATTLVENTNYTVSGGSGSTGTVNLAGGTSPNGAPSASQTLLIRRVLPLTQTDDFVNNDINDAEVTEDRFDKTVMQIQQLDEELGRGLVIPAAETATDALTTLPFDRASQYLAFDASKNPIASPGPAGDNVPVSSFMATVLDDTTAAAARTTLGAASSAASSTDNAAARFDGTDGKTLQNSPLIIADTTGALSRSGNGGIPVQGTNTNDSASAGYVGEIIESTVLAGSAVSLTNATPADVTSISLTAGDWDVWGIVAFTVNGATTMSAALGWINTTSATNPIGSGPNGGAYVQLNVTFATGNGPAFPVGMKRISVASTTTVYLSGQLNFAVNTAAAYGYIGARRVR